MTDRDETSPEVESEEAFLNRMALLRTPETVDSSFEARVMEVARAEAPTLYPRSTRPWWRRPRILRLSPLGGLALAAGLAGLVSLGTLAASAALSGSAPREPARVDTVHVVRFVLAAPGARNVTLVGDFNAWAKEATPLAAVAVDGVWSVSVVLPPGRHEYAFVVDGERWVVDPTAAVLTDEFGTESSVVTVGGADAT